MDPLKKKYLICAIKVDAQHLGDPVCRRRIYFILIRRCADPYTQSKEVVCQLARDVCDKKIKNHLDLEKHCSSAYQKLKRKEPTISVPAA